MTSARLPPYVLVLIAIALGAALGHMAPDLAVQLKPVGDGFIALIKMLIAPVVFCTITLGFVGAGEMRKVGRVGLKAIIYFEVMSTLALALGLAVVNWLQPGRNLHIDPQTLDSGALGTLSKVDTQASGMDFFLRLIPKTLGEPIGSSGEILQVLVVAILFGWAMTSLGAKAKPLLDVIEAVSQVLFKMVNMVMRLAPFGAGAAMAFTVGKFGLSSLLPLASLMVAFYLACLLFVFAVLGAIGRLCGFSIWRLVVHIRQEIVLILGTSSSESALIPLMEKLEKMGCPKSIVGLVVPAGYSFNLDGTNIYLTLAALFVAQALHVDLSLRQQLSLLAVAVITSKGAAGVTGSGFVTLASTLAIFPQIPVVSLTLILGVDRFMSEARAVTNAIGNTVATLVISKWEGELNPTQLATALQAKSSEL